MSATELAAVDAHEGPVYAADEHALYFTSRPRPGHAPRVDIRRLDLADGGVTTIREDAGVANGMAMAPDGRLLVCEQGDFRRPAQISAVDRATGEATTLVDGWRGVPLNSPNDVTVRAADGTIWFTDPCYGFLHGFRPPPRSGDYVYRHDPATGALDPVAVGVLKPNGLCFSPAEDVLYVTDSGANLDPGSYDPTRTHHVLAFDVLEGRALGPSRLLAVVTPGFPDGLKCDAAGRVYASSASGVQVFSALGDLIREIHVPGAVNFAFAGEQLLITTGTAVWTADLDFDAKET